MKTLNSRQLAICALVAALYTVMSYFSAIFGLAYGPIQCRFSEALCVLPFFYPWTAWGLFVGCLLSNLLSAFGPIDIVFGSLTTLVAALLTARCKSRYLAPLPPVILNGIVISFIIAYTTVGISEAFWAMFVYNAVTIAIGEALACYVLGAMIMKLLPSVSYFRELIPQDRLEIVI